MADNPAPAEGHAQSWAEAKKTLQALIPHVDSLHSELVGGHQNLVWQGYWEEYFQHQASDQDSYLNQNLKDLQQLLTWVTQAESDERAKKPAGAKS